MRKFVSFFMVLTVLFGFSAYCVSAQDSSSPAQEVIYLDDGYYMVIKMEEAQVSARSTTTKTKSKTAYLYDSDGFALCKLTLTATFSINVGVSATCTSASYSASANASGWSIASPSATRSGATAKATATAVRKVLGVVKQSIPMTVTLKCDKNGNIT